MSGVIETGSARPRPLSGGFWTLLSWLRGEEHSASSDSISSVGSDRTAVSFAFLAPAHYQAGTGPLILPPQGPPTDSYKKRVRERNLRRQYDRDTTLHRKYGLYRGDGVHFDANSLPPPTRRAGAVNDRKDRERRATSELIQRRAAHVPGKRRAPPPPLGSSPYNTAERPGTAKRRHTRKRPAPKPPVQTTTRSNEDMSFGGNSKIERTSSTSADTQPLSPLGLNSKHERYTKKDTDSRDTKVRSERSFLKQIFETKKKNTPADTTSIKILPSISELDKQAAEIIETSKAKRQSQIRDQNFPPTENLWYCMNCSKWYENSVKCCLLCKIKKEVSSLPVVKEEKHSTTIETQTENASPSPSTSKTQEIEEKQKLKEMLKEMKDSLPKRTKLDNVAVANKNQDKVIVTPILNRKEIVQLETPTLPVGARIENNILNEKRQKRETDSSQNNNLPVKVNLSDNFNKFNEKKSNEVEKQNAQRLADNKESHAERKVLNTPLRISSLLNPIYIPKPDKLLQDQSVKISSSTETSKVEKEGKSTTDQIYVRTADAVREILLNTPANSSPAASSHLLKSRINKQKSSPIRLKNEQSTSSIASGQTPTKSVDKDNLQNINHHSRRRDLVNQLEKSIASGDERAAADAAMKLAQLRLSCSVLSFTSQILQQPQTNPNPVLMTNVSADKSSKQPEKQTNGLVIEDNKKVSRVNDAATSTNNILIKKNTHIIAPTAKDIEEGLKQYLKTEENPRKPVINYANPNTSNNEVMSQGKGSPSKVINIQNTRSEGCAKDASKLKVIAQPSTSKEKTKDEGKIKSIVVWIEDKEKAHGPIRLQIPSTAVMGELRRRAEQALGLPLRLQRWIVGKELCTNDDTTLVSLAGPDLDVPFYLCVVECDENVQGCIRNLCEVKAETKNENGQSNNNNEGNSSGVYKELVNLERQATVPNAEAFECEICMEQCAAGDGVVLRECVHSFCRQCLSDVIRHCEEPAVTCPAMGCPGLLHEREIRALVSPEDYERWLNRGLAAAESGTRNAFHCRTRDCTGWALCEPGARRFPCPVCKHINCVPCQAIHEGETCDQYRKKLEEAAKSTQETDEGTQALIQSLISRGEALQCPECSAVITKKWGCDWVKCSACKTEICWVTRGRRWGPAGRGDTSAGCRCGVDGKRCHPSCGYCH